MAAPSLISLKHNSLEMNKAMNHDTEKNTQGFLRFSFIAGTSRTIDLGFKPLQQRDGQVKKSQEKLTF